MDKLSWGHLRAGGLIPGKAIIKDSAVTLQMLGLGLMER